MLCSRGRPEAQLHVGLAAVIGARRGESWRHPRDGSSLDAGQLVVAPSIVLGPDRLVAKRSKTKRFGELRWTPAPSRPPVAADP